MPSRDYGSVEPFEDPYTPQQHEDMRRAQKAAEWSLVLEVARSCWDRAAGASIVGNERFAAEYRADACEALGLYPELLAMITEEDVKA